MRPNQTLSTLIERAERKGNAVKKVREGNIMGSGWAPNTGDMINQWEVVKAERLDTDGSQIIDWKVYHYDTLIFHINNICAGGWVLQSYYGESITDANALNVLCEHFGISTSFTYGKKKGFVVC